MQKNTGNCIRLKMCGYEGMVKDTEIQGPEQEGSYMSLVEIGSWYLEDGELLKILKQGILLPARRANYLFNINND